MKKYADKTRIQQITFNVWSSRSTIIKKVFDDMIIWICARIIYRKPLARSIYHSPCIHKVPYRYQFFIVSISSAVFQMKHTDSLVCNYFHVNNFKVYSTTTLFMYYCHRNSKTQKNVWNGGYILNINYV